MAEQQLSEGANFRIEEGRRLLEDDENNNFFDQDDDVMASDPDDDAENIESYSAKYALIEICSDMLISIFSK